MAPGLQTLNERGLQRDDRTAFLYGEVLTGNHLAIDHQILKFGIRCTGPDGIGASVVGSVRDGVRVCFTRRIPNGQRTVHRRDLIVLCDVLRPGRDFDIADLFGVNTYVYESVLDAVAVLVINLIVRTQLVAAVCQCRGLDVLVVQRLAVIDLLV